MINSPRVIKTNRKTMLGYQSFNNEDVSSDDELTNDISKSNTNNDTKSENITYVSNYYLTNNLSQRIKHQPAHGRLEFLQNSINAIKLLNINSPKHSPVFKHISKSTKLIQKFQNKTTNDCLIKIGQSNQSSLESLELNSVESCKLNKDYDWINLNNKKININNNNNNDDNINNNYYIDNTNTSHKLTFLSNKTISNEVRSINIFKKKKQNNTF